MIIHLLKVLKSLTVEKQLTHCIPNIFEHCTFPPPYIPRNQYLFLQIQLLMCMYNHFTNEKRDVQRSYLAWPKPRKEFSSLQSLSRVRLFATPWTAAHQASLSIINSPGLPKLMSIELVMPSNHLILCSPLLLLPSIFLNIRIFSNESVLHIGGQSIAVWASASVLPMNIQDCFLLEWTDWISLLSKGLSRVFSNTMVQKHQFFSTQLSS